MLRTGKTKNSLLDGEFAKKANFYLDKNFPAIISEACKIRENSFHDLNLQERFFEAMQSYLTYALEHQTSYYYPAQWVMTQIEKIITSFADAYGTSHSGFEIYENAKRIKAISAKFKSHPALTTPLNLFNRFAQELESQAQMKIIQEVIIVDPDF